MPTPKDNSLNIQRTFNQEKGSPAKVVAEGSESLPSEISGGSRAGMVQQT